MASYVLDLDLLRRQSCLSTFVHYKLLLKHTRCCSIRTNWTAVRIGEKFRNFTELCNAMKLDVSFQNELQVLRYKHTI